MAIKLLHVLENNLIKEFQNLDQIKSEVFFNKETDLTFI